MKTKNQISVLLTLTFFVLMLNSCSVKKKSTEPDVNLYAIDYGDCSYKFDMDETEYCLHQVVNLTPFMGDCNKYAIGDTLCISCNNGVCPSTAKFCTDDGVWLRACIVDTKMIDSRCLTDWPKGTCKYYVKLVKDQ